jgi:hypothetical protein
MRIIRCLGRMHLSKILASVTVASLFIGCTAASDQRFHLDTRSNVSAKSARNLAVQEVHRRGLPLPQAHDIKLRDSFADYEFKPSRPIFAITIYDLTGGKRFALYQMSIDKRSAKIGDFTDMRTVTPVPAGLQQGRD